MNTSYRKKALLISLDCIVRGEWEPGVFRALGAVTDKTDYSLVLVAPSAVPETVQQTLEGEGIVFDDVIEDSSVSEILGEYDLPSSFIIGSELPDMASAMSQGCRGIWYRGGEIHSESVVLAPSSWSEIATFLTGDDSLRHRKAVVVRKTKETDITLSIDLDGTGKGQIHTGIGFFDHMLEQLVKHSRCDMDATVKGDLEVDEHHTVEDTAIVIGEAVRRALGEKRGIERYGYEIVMMDDVVVTAAIDFSGRSEFIWDVEFTMDYIGTFPSELIKHFFRSFSSAAGANLYISALRGGNSHHTAEAVFKAFARCLRKAVRRIPGETGIASTKGVL